MGVEADAEVVDAEVVSTSSEAGLDRLATAVKEYVPAVSKREAALAGGFGPAGARYVRIALRKSNDTQRTYASTLRRFGSWLNAAWRDEQLAAGVIVGDDDHAPWTAFRADALAEWFDQREGDVSAATIRKDRAAINTFTKYLRTQNILSVQDTYELLQVEGAAVVVEEGSWRRKALDRATWKRVKSVAAARLNPDTEQRVDVVAAARDRAIVHLLGDEGLRNHEARGLNVDDIFHKRPAGPAWLKIRGKGAKEREVPLSRGSTRALLDWERRRPSELADDPKLFPRLGRVRRDGSFPDAGGALTDTALRKIVKPLMLAAGVPEHQAHPHVLRHTFGTLYMDDPGAELDVLQELMGHADIATTRRYVHVSDERKEREHARRERRGRTVLEAAAAAGGRHR